MMPTFQTPTPIAVELDLGVGDISIEASERSDTVVEVLPSDPAKPGDVSAAEQTRVDLSGDRLVVRGPRGWRSWMPRGGRESIDVRISLPHGSAIQGDAGVAALRCTGALGEFRFKTGAGDLEVEEAGSVRIRTGAGDVSVGHAAGDLYASTGSGVIRIDTVDGSAVIKSSNRETWIGHVAGDLRVNAANGSISVDQAGATVVLKTANGDIRMGEAAPGAVEARTAFGQIDVGIRAGVAAWLDLDTGFGRVNNELADSERPDAGVETVEVRARTSYGDISIRRASAA
jgi:putative adhesin